MLPFDLHVLSIPPAFNLSQDQTLHSKLTVLKGTIFLTLSHLSFALNFKVPTQIAQ